VLLVRARRAPTVRRGEEAHVRNLPLIMQPALLALSLVLLSAGAAAQSCAYYVPEENPSFTTGNYYPFGGQAPDTIESTFNDNNNGAIGGAVYFNVTTYEPLYLHGLELNALTNAGAPLHCDVYRTNQGATYLGNETNLAAWQPKTAGRGVSAGVGQPSAIELAEPMWLPPGNYGFAVVAMDFAHAYTTSSSTSFYFNSRVMISTGAACNTPFEGFVNEPRDINVRLRYRTEDAAASNMIYQTILRQDQLGPAGMITDLAVMATGTGRHWNRDISVRMSHVPAGTTLSSTFADNLPNPFTALNATNFAFAYREDEFVEIGLQNAFPYDGTSDVVVELLLRGNVQTTTGNDGLFYRTSNLPRVYDADWSSTPPATGTADNSGMHLRVTFGCARANEFGSPCGRLNASHVGEGARGQTFSFVLQDALPSSIAFVGLGFQDLLFSPFPLDGIGWTNCNAYSLTEVIETALTDAAGGSSFLVPIPNDPAIDGAPLYGQWFQLDASEPGELTFSQLTRMRVGVAEL